MKRDMRTAPPEAGPLAGLSTGDTVLALSDLYGAKAWLATVYGWAAHDGRPRGQPGFLALSPPPGRGGGERCFGRPAVWAWSDSSTVIRVIRDPEEIARWQLAQLGAENAL